MRLLLVMLSLLFGFSIGGINKQESFIQKVEENYTYYEFYESTLEKDAGYELVIVRGIYSGQPAYGILFVNEKSSHKLRFVLKQGENTYMLPNDYAIAIDGSKDYEFQILTFYNANVIIYDNKLPSFKVDDLKSNDRYIMGDIDKTSAPKFSKLKEYSLSDSYFNILGIVTLAMLGLFCIGFLSYGIYYLINKKNKKNSTKVTIKDILFDESTNVIKEVDYSKLSTNTINTIKEDVFNLDEYLKSKGYTTNYEELDEESKNKVMIELMILKETKKISNDMYTKETSRLWKR